MTVGIILVRKGREVVTIDLTATLKEAAVLLAEKRIGAALILGADHRIAGILSERDVVRALAEGGAAALDLPVSRTMTRKVETCSEGEAVSSIMERMTVGKFRHMPVVDQGRLVGVISIGDVVKHRVHEMEHEITRDARLHPDRLEAGTSFRKKSAPPRLWFRTGSRAAEFLFRAHRVTRYDPPATEAIHAGVDRFSAVGDVGGLRKLIDG